MVETGKINIILGCEESQAVTIEFRKLGFNAFSCDLKPCSGGHPEWHIQADIFEVLGAIKFYTSDNKPHFVNEWHAGIFFPDCTYLTNSAEWAYKEPPYHQKVKPGTLTGKLRLEARQNAVGFVLELWNSGIPLISIENPIGKLSSAFMKPSQILQPWYFGHSESKSTCLWLKGLPLLKPTQYADFKNYRCSCGNVFPFDLGKYGCCDKAAKPLWDNMTKSGQNKLPPGEKRAELRSKTYPGIAKAMAEQWSEIILNHHI